MTCCDLRAATAQELCAGLAGDCPSQLKTLSELQSWLKSSLPASSSAGSDFLLTRNDYRGEEFDEAASKTEALRDVSVFIDAIPKLMTSSNAEVVAAAVRTFALFLHCKAHWRSSYCHVWLLDVVPALNRVVMTGYEHPAFVDAVDILAELAGGELFAQRLIRDSEIIDYVIDLLSDQTRATTTVHIRGHLLQLISVMTLKPYWIEQFSSHCVQLEQICVSTVMDKDAEQLATAAAVHILSTLHGSGYGHAVYQSSVLNRIIDLEKQHQQLPYVVNLLACIVKSGPDSLRSPVVASGFIDRLIAAALDGTNKTDCSQQVIALIQLQELIKQRDSVRAQLVQCDAATRLTGIASSYSAPMPLRAQCLLTLGVLIEHTDISLDDANIELLHSAVLDMVASMSPSMVALPQLLVSSNRLMEAADILHNSIPRFRALFTAEAFCHMWLEHARSTLAQLPSPSTGCCARLTSLLRLLFTHVDLVRRRMISSLQPYITSGVVAVVIDLLDHSCEYVAFWAISAWSVFQDDSHVVADGGVLGVSVDRLVSFLSQPSSSAQICMARHVINSMQQFVEQLSAAQCRQLLAAVIHFVQQHGFPTAMSLSLSHAVELTHALVSILDEHDPSVAEAFDKLVEASTSSSDTPVAQHSISFLHQYIVYGYSFPSSTLPFPPPPPKPHLRAHYLIPRRLIHAVIELLKISSNVRVRTRLLYQLWSLVISDDGADVSMMTLDSGLIGMIPALLAEDDCTLLRSAVLGLIAQLMYKYNRHKCLVLSSSDYSILIQLAETVINDPSLLCKYAAEYGRILSALIVGDSFGTNSGALSSLALHIINQVTAASSESQLVACLIFTNCLVSRFATEDILAALLSVFPAVIRMAINSESLNARRHSRQLMHIMLEWIPFDTLAPVLSNHIDSLLSAFNSRHSEPPFIASELVKVFSEICQTVIKCPVVSLKSNVERVLSCFTAGLMDERFLQYDMLFNSIWFSARHIPADALSRYDSFSWLASQLCDSLINGRGASSGLSPYSDYLRLDIHGSLAASGLSAVVVNLIHGSNDTVTCIVCTFACTLLNVESRFALSLTRDGLVRAISERVSNDNNNNANSNSNSNNNYGISNESRLSLLDLLMTLHQSVDISLKPTSPPHPFTRRPLHLPLPPPPPPDFGHHRRQQQRHDRRVQRHVANMSLLKLQIQPIVVQLLTSLPLSTLVYSQTISLSRLESQGLLGETLQKSLIIEMAAGLDTPSVSEQLAVLKALMFHLGSNGKRSSDHAAHLASSMHFVRILDLVDVGNPPVVRAAAMSVVDCVFNGQTELALQVLSRYPVSYFTQLALDQSVPRILSHVAIETLSSLCKTVSKSTTHRKDMVAILECFSQLLQRHNTAKKLFRASFNNILDTIQFLTTSNVYVVRMMDLDIIPLLFRMAFSGNHNQRYPYDLRKSLVSILRYHRGHNQPLYVLAAVSAQSQLASPASSIAFYDLIEIFTQLVPWLDDADSFWHLLVDSSILELVHSIIHNPFALTMWQNTVNLFFQMIWRCARRPHGDQQLSHLLQLSRNGQPLLMSMAVQSLRHISHIFPVNIFREYDCLEILFSASHPTNNVARTFVECGGLAAYRNVLRSSCIADVQKVSMLWLLNRCDVYKHDPADLALGSLADEHIEIPDEMPALYDY